MDVNQSNSVPLGILLLPNEKRMQKLRIERLASWMIKQTQNSGSEKIEPCLQDERTLRINW